jgi:hypothetical protein
MVHEVHEAPEHSFLILDVNEHQCHYVVESLHVTNFLVVVRIRFAHVEQFVIAALDVFAPEFEISHSPVDVLLKKIFNFFIRELSQFLVQIVRVANLGFFGLE